MTPQPIKQEPIHQATARSFRRLASSQHRPFVGLAFISPWLIGFLVLTLYPILASLYFSFCDYRVLSPPVWVGLRNYQELFTDHDYFLPSLANTAFMFLALPIGTFFSVCIAMLLNRKLKGMAIFRTIFYLPSVVPVVASSVLWLWLLNPEYGLVNKSLGVFGIPASQWLQNPATAKWAFIIMEMWMIGGSIVIYLAALQGVPQPLYEAAELDGASPWTRAWKITIPSISPVIFFNFILGTIGTFQYFTQSFLMTGRPPGGPANSTLFFALYLFQNAFAFFRMGYASAMAWVLFLLTLIATLIVFKSSARWVYYEGDN
jgi:multiple sugar transport system permease protein